MTRRISHLVVLLGLIVASIGLDVGRAAAETNITGPGALDFGPVPGRELQPGEVVIRNSGTAAVDLGLASYTGPFGPGRKDGCSDTTLNPGSTCVVEVKPNIDAPLGEIVGSLSINGADDTSLATVSLRGLRYTSTFAAAGGGGAPFDDYTFMITDDVSVESAWSTPGLFVHQFKYFGDPVELRLVAPTSQNFSEGRWSNVDDRAYLVRPGLSVAVDGQACADATSDVDLEHIQIDAEGQLTGLRASILYRCRLRLTTMFIEYSTKDEVPDEPWVGPRQLDLGTQLSSPIRASILAVKRAGEMPLPNIDGSQAPGFDVAKPSCEARWERHSCRIDIALSPYTVSSRMDQPVTVTAGVSTNEVVLTATAGTAAFAWRYVIANGIAEIVTHEDDTFRVSERQDGEIDMFGGGERIEIWPPGLEDFEVGTYSVGEQFDRSPGQAGLRITRQFDTCPDDPGKLIIHELSRHRDGSLATLRISVAKNCAGGVRAYGSTFAYNVALGVPEVVTTPDAIAFSLSDPARKVRLVTLTNQGEETVRLYPRFRRDDRHDYWLADDGCDGVLLGPQESCTQGIGFQPFGRGLEATSAELEFVDSDGAEVFALALYGTASSDWSPGPPPPTRNASGYWVLQADGNVTPLGDARHLGNTRANSTMIEISATPTGRGYWLLDNFGNVYSHGDALVLGGLDSQQLESLWPGEIPVSMSPTPTSNGYWIFTTRGRVFRFGDATDIGSLVALDLNQPIIDAVATPSGRGVYMIALDGGVFALGDASFAGSVPQVLPGVRLNRPVVGLVPDPDGVGYWLVAEDGGVFAFEADFNGSIPSVLPAGTRLRAAINGMVTYGNGYLLVASDGGIFNFSDLGFVGSLAGSALQAPVVAIAPIVDDAWFYR